VVVLIRRHPIHQPDHRRLSSQSTPRTERWCVSCLKRYHSVLHTACRHQPRASHRAVFEPPHARGRRAGRAVPIYSPHNNLRAARLRVSSFEGRKESLPEAQLEKAWLGQDTACGASGASERVLPRLEGRLCSQGADLAASSTPENAQRGR
jgi:hypothetical protein